MAAKILVVGSINMDLVARVEHVPAPGENVRGTDLRTIPGGKGANQAVAFARLGAETRLLGRVGDDAFGGRLRQELAAAGVRTDALGTVEGSPSGVALILLACPTAVASYVLADQLDGDAALSAGAIVASTLLSVVSLGVVVALV